MRGEWEIAAAIGALMRVSDATEDRSRAKVLASYACALEWALGVDHEKESCIGGLINEAAETGRSVYSDGLSAHDCELDRFLEWAERDSINPL